MLNEYKDENFSPLNDLVYECGADFGVEQVYTLCFHCSLLILSLALDLRTDTQTGQTGAALRCNRLECQ